MPAPPKIDNQTYAAMMADPILRARLEQSLVQMLDQYKWFMKNGSASDKLQLLKTALPDLLRHRRSEEEGNKDQLQRDAFARMREGFAEHIKVNVPEWPQGGKP